MARKQGSVAAMAQANGQAERQRLAAFRAQEKAQLEAMSARERAVKAVERARSSDEKAARRACLEARQDEADAMQADIVAQREALEGVLAATLKVDDHIDPDTLKHWPAIPPFDGATLANAALAPSEFAHQVPALTLSLKLVPGAKVKHEGALAKAAARLAAEITAWHASEQSRQADLAAAREACLDDMARLAVR